MYRTAFRHLRYNVLFRPGESHSHVLQISLQAQFDFLRQTLQNAWKSVEPFDLYQQRLCVCVWGVNLPPLCTDCVTFNTLCTPRVVNSICNVSLQFLLLDNWVAFFLIIQLFCCFCLCQIPTGMRLVQLCCASRKFLHKSSLCSPQPTQISGMAFHP